MIFRFTITPAFAFLLFLQHTILVVRTALAQQEQHQQQQFPPTQFPPPSLPPMATFSTGIETAAYYSSTTNFPPFASSQHQQQPQFPSVSGGGGGGRIGTHVLDIVSGRAAPGVNCTAHWWDAVRQNWILVGMRLTNEHGRVHSLLAPELGPPNAGVYKIRFETEPYLRALGRPAFFPFIEVVFVVDNPSQKYHVPLTLSNYGYSAYLGQ